MTTDEAFQFTDEKLFEMTKMRWIAGMISVPQQAQEIIFNSRSVFLGH
jgi:hypothetical protein